MIFMLFVSKIPNVMFYPGQTIKHCLSNIWSLLVILVSVWPFVHITTLLLSNKHKIHLKIFQNIAMLVKQCFVTWPNCQTLLLTNNVWSFSHGLLPTHLSLTFSLDLQYESLVPAPRLLNCLSNRDCILILCCPSN